MQWEAEWQKEVWDSLLTLWENPAMANDTGGRMLSVDHLCGQVEWVEGVRQAAEIPWGHSGSGEGGVKSASSLKT